MPILSLLNKHKRVEGFTVVEMLVATAVFAIVIVTVMQLLIMFLRGPLQQIRKKQLEEQVTYATSEIARYIREGKSFNYTAATAYTDFLTVTTVTGETHIIELSTNGNITIDTNLLTGNNVKITNLQFYIYPNADPTVIQADGSSVNNQPAVMMVIDAQRADDPKITTHFQTLTTSRYYAR
ncbi:MAG: prepilin-type N-terminal cleavage/methylation domain-containing protein [Patescibacteria group bacterium]|jgi:type II secretory pathway pseudopilin PulG